MRVDQQWPNTIFPSRKTFSHPVQPVKIHQIAWIIKYGHSNMVASLNCNRKPNSLVEIEPNAPKALTAAGNGAKLGLGLVYDACFAAISTFETPIADNATVGPHGHRQRYLFHLPGDGSAATDVAPLISSRTISTYVLLPPPMNWQWLLPHFSTPVSGMEVGKGAS